MKSTSPKYLIVVAGPTASGKSSLAMDLAKKFNCPIVSADSRQIYKSINIGTAKPTTEDLKEVPHYLIDHINLEDAYNVGKYESDAIEALDHIFKTNDFAILCGGTGLYIKVVLQGIDQFPDIDISVRDRYTKLWKEEGIEPLQNELKKVDPEYHAKVDLQNPHRLIRALSIYASSGKKFSEFLLDNIVERPFKPLPIYLNIDKKILIKRINNRVDQMIKDGLIEEAKALYPNKDIQSLNTVGYKELFDHFDGTLSLEESIERIKIHTRQYAKRQRTWFNKYYEAMHFSNTNRLEIIKYLENQLEMSK